MKKAAIISCNDNYDYDTRTKYINKYLEELGFEVDFIVADFDHRNKKKYVAIHPGNIKYVQVKEYKRNLSVARIISHLEFAHKVSILLSKSQYDLVYHCAPPNSTIREISKLRNKRDFTLITEIGDMWPETMPVSKKIKKIGSLPLYIWRSFRDKYLYNSDVIIAECELFKNQLIKNTGLNKIKTVYFCKDAQYINEFHHNKIQNSVELCYLGSINNIIDYSIVAMLVEKISKRKRVNVHIIGDGEKKNEMIDYITKSGGNVVFHGIIFNDEKKREIFSKCHYALNVMKNDVYVGMTMKSLDYFAFGIPMINNIGADIGHMISKYNLGFNINIGNCNIVADEIINMSENDYKRIRENVRSIHMKYFSIESFNNKMDRILGGKNEKNTSV